MRTQNILLTEFVSWLSLQDPFSDDPEQEKILVEILSNLTTLNQDLTDYLEVRFDNLEHVFIYFIKLKNILSRYHHFLPQMEDFFTVNNSDHLLPKVLTWLENFCKYINEENNFADMTDLLVSWQSDIDMLEKKVDLIKNLLIHYLHMKNILKKYHSQYEALTELYS